MWDWGVYAICQGEKGRVVVVEDVAVARGQGDQGDQVKSGSVNRSNNKIASCILKYTWTASWIKPLAKRTMPTPGIQDKWDLILALAIKEKVIVSKEQDLIISVGEFPANLANDKNPIINQNGFELAIIVDKVSRLIGKVRYVVGAFEVEFIEWG